MDSVTMNGQRWDKTLMVKQLMIIQAGQCPCQVMETELLLEQLTMMAMELVQAM